MIGLIRAATNRRLVSFHCGLRPSTRGAAIQSEIVNARDAWP